MRDAIGGTWIMSIVIVFIVLFVAFVCIQMNMSRTTQFKSDALTAIEEYEGMNDNTLKKIQSLMSKHAYRSKGKCGYPSGAKKKGSVFGVNGNSMEKVTNKNKKYDYCIFLEKRNKITGDAASIDKYYYTIQTFFPFRLPVIGDVYTFRITGETNGMAYVNETKIKNENDIYKFAE